MPFKEILFEHITYFNTNLLTHQKTTTQKKRSTAFLYENKDDNINKSDLKSVALLTCFY